MSRDITEAFGNELEASTSRPAIFYKGVFSETALRLWSGRGDKVFNSELYLGNGWLMDMGTTSETLSINATNITVTLAGLPTTLISILLSQSDHVGTGELWLAFLDDSKDIIENPYRLFKGKLEQPQLEATPEGSRIIIGYESVLAALLRRRERRYTAQDQRNFYPDDLGLQFAAQAASWTGWWGQGESKLNIRRRDRR